MSKTNETVGNAVPNGSRRGCMCKNGTYSRKCCDGTLRSQGVGKIRGEVYLGDEYYYRVQRCGHNMKKEIHLHDTELIVGNVYYLEFENSGHSNCYTVLNIASSGEHHINSATLYSDCTACIDAN